MLFLIINFFIEKLLYCFNKIISSEISNKLFKIFPKFFEKFTNILEIFRETFIFIIIINFIYTNCCCFDGCCTLCLNKKKFILIFHFVFEYLPAMVVEMVLYHVFLLEIHKLNDELLV